MIAVVFSDNVRYFDIRKLTERENFRLMDVDEGDIDTMLVGEGAISKTAAYKLAGNSIVVGCLYAIYKNLWLPEKPRRKQSLFAEEQFKLPLPKTINVVTLCSGYDSQMLAMRRFVDYARCLGHNVSFDLKYWSEYDPETPTVPLDRQPAVVAHNLLFPEWADRNLGDMTACDWHAAAERLNGEEIDLLTYSTPCQSISQAGKRAGIARDSGTRSAVLWYTENAIRELRPKVLLQENVGALVNKLNMPHFEEWQQVCRRCGYDNYWTILNAKDFGVAQNRERVFMVSVRSDLNMPTFEFPEGFPLTTSIADYVDDDVDGSYYLSDELAQKFLEIQFKDVVCDFIITESPLTAEQIATSRSRFPEIERMKKEKAEREYEENLRDAAASHGSRTPYTPSLW